MVTLISIGERVLVIITIILVCMVNKRICCKYNIILKYVSGQFPPFSVDIWIVNVVNVYHLGMKG